MVQKKVGAIKFGQGFRARLVVYPNEQTTGAPIQISVTNFDPLEQVKITLVRPDNSMFTATIQTDNYGSFSFMQDTTNQMSGSYMIYAEGENKQKKNHTDKVYFSLI